MRISDWSSDVCSSDLSLACALPLWPLPLRRQGEAGRGWSRLALVRKTPLPNPPLPSQGREQSSRLKPLHKTSCDLAHFPCRQPSRPRPSRSAASPSCWAGWPCSARSRSEEHTSELQSLMRISYAVFCLKNKNQQD